MQSPRRPPVLATKDIIGIFSSLIILVTTGSWKETTASKHILLDTDDVDSCLRTEEHGDGFGGFASMYWYTRDNSPQDENVLKGTRVLHYTRKYNLGKQKYLHVFGGIALGI